MRQALRECLRARRAQIEELLDRVGHAAQGDDPAGAVRLMVEAQRHIEKLLSSEELLLTPMYAHAGTPSAALRDDHVAMRATVQRALEFLEHDDVTAFADEAQILMSKILTHGHREDQLLNGGHFVDGDPEHDAIAARFVRLFRS